MPTPHVRLTWGGPLGTSKESWSCSLSIGTGGGDQPGAAAPAISQASLDATVAAVKALHSRGETQIYATAGLTWVKLARLGADFRYLDDARLVEFERIVGGIQNGTQHPYQVARVVTLHTGRRGASNRGRFYLPMPAATIGPDGLTNGPESAAIAGSAATFLGAVNAAFTDPTVNVVVAGKRGSVVVTKVTCGRVLDTVRSRRRGLAEDYPADIPVT